MPSNAWAWSDIRPLPLELPDKTTPAPLRLLNVMAPAALVFSSAQLRRIAERPALRFLHNCGRHSLEVFSPGTVLATLYRLIFRSFAVTWMTQLAANGVGLALIISLPTMLEHAR